MFVVLNWTYEFSYAETDLGVYWRVRMRSHASSGKEWKKNLASIKYPFKR